MEKETLDEALEVLGTYLSDKGLKFEVVAIGGGSLVTLGVHNTSDKRFGCCGSNGK